MTRLSDAAVARVQSLDDTPQLRDARYQLREELGRGGMGVVYRVFDTVLGRDAALKVITPVAGARDAHERLRRESRALAQLEHPGIVPVYDVGLLADDRAFYVMKLVDGERLDQRMTRGLTLGDGLRIVVRVCDAVAFAHTRGVIHRDLKPQNVMLAPFGEVLVMDWGTARIRSESRREFTGLERDGVMSAEKNATADGVVVGTPGYMAPEQASGRVGDVDERSDVYALGVVLREVAASALEGSRLPPPLASIVARATAESRAERYSGPTEFGKDIAAFLDRLPVSAHRESLVERIGRLSRRHRMAITLILAYILVRIAMLAFLRN